MSNFFRRAWEHAQIVKIDCCSCDDFKTLNDFHFDSTHESLRSRKCKFCTSDYHQKNKEVFNERSRIYRSKHRDRLIEMRKDNYQENKERERIYGIQWQYENMESVLARNAKRQKELGTGYRKSKKFLFESFGNVCQMCKEEFEYDELQVDHIWPFSKKEMFMINISSMANLQLLCKSCNPKKGNRLPEHFSIFENPFTSERMMNFEGEK